MRIRNFLVGLPLAALIPLSSVEAATFCRLSDGPDSFKVIEWTNTVAQKPTLGFHLRDVIETGDDHSGDVIVGVFIIDPANARTIATSYVSVAGQSTHLHLEGTGQRTDRTLGVEDSGINTVSQRSILQTSIAPGTYHVVGVTIGGGSGVSLDGTDDETEAFSEFSAPGMSTCSELDVSGSIKQYDEHDFVGTQISAPLAGYRSNVLLNHDSTSQFVAGTLHHDATDSFLEISTPSGGGAIGQESVPISSVAGRYSFKARQTGLGARISIGLLEYSLAS